MHAQGCCLFFDALLVFCFWQTDVYFQAVRDFLVDILLDDSDFAAVFTAMATFCIDGKSIHGGIYLGCIMCMHA